jgi:hypothetical protein
MSAAVHIRFGSVASIVGATATILAAVLREAR